MIPRQELLHLRQSGAVLLAVKGIVIKPGAAGKLQGYEALSLIHIFLYNCKSADTAARGSGCSEGSSNPWSSPNFKKADRILSKQVSLCNQIIWKS